MRTLLLLALGLALISGANFVDFERWEIVVSGELHLEALSAKEISFSAKEALKDCFYNSEMTLRDFLMSNPRIERKFNQLKLNSFPKERGLLSDGTTLMEFRTPITGELLNLLAPPTGGGVPLGRIACPLCGQPWPEGKEFPEGIVPIPLESEELPKYSGVIIDARRIDLKPSLFPRVLDEEGREVYGPSFVDQEEMVKSGIVQYTLSLNSPELRDRVGDSFILISPLRTEGKYKCDVVISSQDARRIHSSPQGLVILLPSK